MGKLEVGGMQEVYEVLIRVLCKAFIEEFTIIRMKDQKYLKKLQ